MNDDWDYVTVREFIATLIVGILWGLACIVAVGYTIVVGTPS